MLFLQFHRELAEVKEHDYTIAELADNAQEELASALAQSQRNSQYTVMVILFLVYNSGIIELCLNTTSCMNSNGRD